MAVTQVYTAVANDVITAARWNNEFGNIYNNGTDIAFPLTKAVSLAGYTLTLDNAGNSTIISPATSGLNLTAGAKTGTPAVSLGANLNIAASTFTDSATAGSGTATSFAANAVQRPTLAASNASVLCTDAATWYIANSPANGSNETISNPWSLWVDAGNVRFDGELVAAVNPWSLSVSMAANAVTVTLLGVNGATTGQIPLKFRSATDTTAAATTVMASAGTSVVISSGSTLNTVDAVPNRIWIGAINNAGTVELFVYNSLSYSAIGAFPQNLTGPSVKRLPVSGTISTTAEGGAGTADNAHIPYSTTARSTVAFCWLGYFESTQATKGTWASAATKVHVYDASVALPGTILQTKRTIYTDVATGTTALPADNSTPGIGEGDQFMNASITPTSACNLLMVDALGYFAHSAVTTVAMALNDGSNTLCAGAVAVSATGVVGIGRLEYYAVANGVASITYYLRAGANTGATTTFNGVGGAVRYNYLFSHLNISEIAI